MIFIDEFPELFQLSNYPQIGKVTELLHRLMEVDLITQDGDLYDFRDPVGAVREPPLLFQGIELPVIPRQQVLSQLVTEVSQRDQRISSQLGLARESQVRELIAAFDGQEVPGTLFGGHDHTVRLPTWKLVAPHQTPDGQLELDVVATGDVVWVAEIKWKNQPARRAERKSKPPTCPNLPLKRLPRSGLSPERAFANRLSVTPVKRAS